MRDQQMTVDDCLPDKKMLQDKTQLFPLGEFYTYFAKLLLIVNISTSHTILNFLQMVDTVHKLYLVGKKKKKKSTVTSE